MTLARPTGVNGRDLQKRAQVIRIARAIKLMLVGLDRPFDLDALARSACVSRYHFVRQFRALTGNAPEAFHRKLRLQRAAWSLISSDSGIAEIAFGSGFATSDGFSRAFRRVYGVSPAAFRRLRADPWAGFSRFGYWRPTELQTPRPPSEGRIPMELKDLPAMIYAGARNVGPYNTVGPAFERVVGWAASAGLMTPETKVLGLSWDNPFEVPAERLRYDAAVTLRYPVDTPDDIRVAALPALTWATTVHKGSYARMTETFTQLGKEIGERPDLVFVPFCGLEIYLNDPDNVPEDELLTEIGMPVVKVG